MMNDNPNSSGGNILGLLGVLFVGLKLGGVIGWSWWYVTLPLWGGAAVGVIILTGAGIGLFAAKLVDRKQLKPVEKRKVEMEDPYMQMGLEEVKEMALDA